MIGINSNPPDQSHRPRRIYGVDVRNIYLLLTYIKTLTLYAFIIHYEWIL
jgi:hypothetical protein